MFRWLRERRERYEAEWRAEHERMTKVLAERQREMDAWRKEYAMRKLLVSQRILKHGYLPLGFLPGVEVEMLEAFADELDAREQIIGGGEPCADAPTSTNS